jgi:hypothetical protein
LFLPNSRSVALHALQLYPAQSTKARGARAFVQALIRLGLLTFLSKRSLSLATKSPFAAFLQSFTRTSTLPDFAVLVGNPHAPGTRFIFLIFDKAGLPACIVKAGLSPEARDLVRREHRFLSENNHRFSGLPAPLGFSEEPEHTALALPYIEGRSPAADEAAHAAALLSAWRTETDPIPLGALPAWQALDTNDPIFQSLPRGLTSLKIHPVLMHGDFAPWNVRVSPRGTWTAFDWERGQFPGVPAWDWFHYVVQTSILVRKESPNNILLRLQSLVASGGFQTYAAITGIRSHELSLLGAYLIHASQLRQTEGATALKQLQELVDLKCSDG